MSVCFQQTVMSEENRGVKAVSGGLTWDSSQPQTPVRDQVTFSVRFLPRVSCVQAGLQCAAECGKRGLLSKGVVLVFSTYCVTTQVDLGFSVFLFFFTVCEKGLPWFYDTHTSCSYGTPRG